MRLGQARDVPLSNVTYPLHLDRASLSGGGSRLGLGDVLPASLEQVRQGVEEGPPRAAAAAALWHPREQEARQGRQDLVAREADDADHDDAGVGLVEIAILQAFAVDEF